MENREYKVIVADIRRESKRRRGRREPCCICGKHELITEYHHLIPVEEMARYLFITKRDRYPMPMVWICPNHHAYFHLKGEDFAAMAFGCLSEDEFENLGKLLQIRKEILHEFHEDGEISV